ncbi:MAG: YqjF family protein [Gaiellaceae bacterium]
MIGLTDLVEAPARQAGTLEHTAHRPWAVPEGSWVMAQTWDDLLFAHWRAPADALRALLPVGLDLDLFQDEAWIGITPFRVTGLRARGLPPLPFVSSFLELNTRTYVTAGGKPGIWFFSLDASSELAVLAARYGYKLPYYRAEMQAGQRGGELAYDSRRRDAKGPPAAFQARYGPDGDLLEPDPRSLAHFLTERYCLYTVDDGRLKRGEIHHPPWPLQPATAEIGENSMPPPGVEPADEDPLLHFSARQDVLIWPLDDA